MRIVLCLFILLLSAVASAAKFTTQAFDVLYEIQPNGDVRVQETIKVTFTEPQRGLIRKLPYRTQAEDGQIRTVTYALLGVGQDTGRGLARGETQDTYADGDWSVRIGNPNRFLRGPVTYVITYRISGGMTPFAEHEELGRHSEFYWNLLPTEWETPIQESKILVRFPQPEEGPVEVKVALGPVDVSVTEVAVGRETPVAKNPALPVRLREQSLEIGPLRNLPQGHSVTLALALPGDTVVAPPPQIESGASDITFELPEFPAWMSIFAFGPLAFLPVIFAITRGRWVPKGYVHRPMVVRYEPPPDVAPSLSGLLRDANVDRRDIVAGIVSIAQKGAIRMHHQDEGSVVLELLGSDGLTDTFDQTLYSTLEPYGPLVTPKKLKGNFGSSYSLLVNALKLEAQTRAFMKDVSGIQGCGGCLFFALMVPFTIFGLILNPLWALGSGLLTLIAGFWMIGKVTPFTAQGLDTRWHLAGLYEFISRANRRELNYMADRLPDQALFEELLPYAVAFDLVKQWTKAFEGIELEMPEWYAGSPGTSSLLWTSMIANDLADINRSYGDAMAPVSSSGTGSGFSSGGSSFGGGGGFSSGGGGGGGGGSSW